MSNIWKVVRSQSVQLVKEPSRWHQVPPTAIRIGRYGKPVEMYVVYNIPALAKKKERVYEMGTIDNDFSR